MPKGGKRIGAGRKPKVDEDRVRNLAIQTIVSKYGSESAGLTALLDSGEPSLVKFVYEHAYGKPKEHIEHSGEMGITWNEVKTYGANDKANEGS